jgi:hypothetical protein
VGTDLAAVLLAAEIADLKEIDYRNTLALCSLIELLCERGVIRREELAAKARALDALGEAACAPARPPRRPRATRRPLAGR